MQFKSLDDKFNWQTKGNRELRFVLIILDAITQLFFEAEIVITSTWREKGVKPSYHSLWQAADLRTKDLPPFVITVWKAVVTLINKLSQSFSNIKGRFDLVYEKRKTDPDGKITREEHCHLEYDTGNPI